MAENKDKVTHVVPQEDKRELRLDELEVHAADLVAADGREAARQAVMKLLALSCDVDGVPWAHAHVNEDLAAPLGRDAHLLGDEAVALLLNLEAERRDVRRQRCPVVVGQHPCRALHVRSPIGNGRRAGGCHHSAAQGQC